MVSSQFRGDGISVCESVATTHEARTHVRSVAILVIPLSFLTLWILPRVTPVVRRMRGVDKWKRMDILGSDLLLATLVFFMLAWTQVETAGWGNALFIAPLTVSLCILPFFFLWESKLPIGFSLLPHDLWRFPNIGPLVLAALTIFLCRSPPIDVELSS